MMKIILFIFLFVRAILAQSPLMLLMDDGVTAPTYPVTADLIHSYDEREMTIASWADQTGTLDWVQATEGNQPALTADALDGYSGLLFNGTDESMLTNTTTSLNQPMTFYLVINLKTITDSDFMFGYNGIYVIESSTEIYLFAGGYGCAKAMSANTYMILTLVVNGANSIIQVDDGSPTTGDTGANNISAGTTGGLGTLVATGGESNIEIVAMYWHNTAHEAATIAEAVTFLQTKYPSLQ